MRLRIFLVYINKGLPGVLGNKGTLPKYRREHRTYDPFFGNRGTKLYNEKLVSQFIKRGTNNYENAWKHGRVQENKDPFWKTLINFLHNFRVEQRNSSNLIGRAVPYMTLYKPLQAVYIKS